MNLLSRLVTVFAFVGVSGLAAACSAESNLPDDGDVTVEDGTSTTQSEPAIAEPTIADPKVCPTRSGTPECRGNGVGASCTTTGGAAGTCVYVFGGGLFSSGCSCQ
jgi:hypothetical protein